MELVGSEVEGYMPGNEIAVAEFIVDRLGNLTLPHLGVIKQLGLPIRDGGYRSVHSVPELHSFSSNNAVKKADFYLNGKGVSAKQTGGSFAFNRIQRVFLPSLLQDLEIERTCDVISHMDQKIEEYHLNISSQKISWKDLFHEQQFFVLLEYLMMRGSPSTGLSPNPAELILEAPSFDLDEKSISIFSFKDYFAKYHEKIFFRIKRSWFGQTSETEHNRARSIMSKFDNQPWVYKTIAGNPQSWRPEVDVSDRKTVYYLMIEKNR